MASARSQTGPNGECISGRNIAEKFPGNGPGDFDLS